MSFDQSNKKVGAFVERYLAENGYSADSYEAPRFRVKVGSLTLNFPNPGRLPYHDLHHVVSGYGTGLVGEAQESIYELRGGCPTNLIRFLCFGSIAIGMLLSPAAIVRAWRQTKGSKTLYDSTIPYAALLEMDIAELRMLLNIPQYGFGRTAETEGANNVGELQDRSA